MNRLGVTPVEFYWDFTPLELHYALKDHRAGQDNIMNAVKSICLTIRTLGLVVFNYSGFGRKKTIDDPKRLWKFSWEEDTIEIQTVEKMKAAMMNIAAYHNRKLKKEKNE